MVYVKIKYRDEYTQGKWSTAQGTFPTLEYAKFWWGLDKCEHEILESKEVEDGYKF